MTLMQLITHLRVNKKFLIPVVLILIISHVLVQSFFPYLTKIIIDDVFGKGNFDLLSKILIFTVLLALSSGILEYIKKYIIVFLAENMVANFKEDLIKKIRNLKYINYEKKDTGEYVSIFQNDINWLSHLLNWTFPSFVQVVLQVIVTSVILFNLSWKITLLALITFPIPFVINYLFTKKIKDTSTQVQHSLGNQTKLLGESLKATKEIKVFRRDDWDTRRLKNVFNEIIPLQLFATHYRTTSLSINMVMHWVILGMLYWIGGGLVLKETISLGTMIACVSYLTSLFGPLNQISLIYNDIQSALGGLNEAKNILSEEKGLVERSPEQSLIQTGIQKDITLRDVTFSYDGKENVLRNITHSFEKGKTTAIVGESGSGKSSLMKILAGLYAADMGEVIGLVNQQKAIVFQDSHFFSGTIYENIVFGLENICEEKLINVCKIAQVDSFVQNLQEGYSTMMGEDGVRLSGGQKQRIALARALLSEPDLLLLDEATSALDPKTERMVNHNIMQRYTEKMTRITVAHRLESIRNADYIIVLKDNTIVEKGTYEELIRNKNEFWNLHASEENRELSLI